MDEIIQHTIDALGMQREDIIFPRTGRFSAITIEELLYLMYPDNGTEEIAAHISRTAGTAKGTFTAYLGKIYTDKPRTVKWSAYLFAKAGYSFCNKCKELRLLQNFSRDTTRFLNITSKCKSCCSNNTAEWADRVNYYEVNKSDFIARNAKRRAAKLQATPSWADSSKIKEIYKACPEGSHVDHEIPLTHPLVCGLHVHQNLRILSASENLSKGNKFEIV